jgi:hypothetical protein
MKRVMPWGKFAGRKISELETGYLKWILDWTAQQADWNRFRDLSDGIEYELEGRRLEAEYQRYKRERKPRRKSWRIGLAVMDEQNRMAARIIAGNPRRYPGLMQWWAGQILSQNPMRARHDPHWQK